MSRKLKVVFVPMGRLAAILFGTTKIRNIPADAEVIGFHPVDTNEYGRGMGLLVTSNSFVFVPHGQQLPVTVASFVSEARG